MVDGRLKGNRLAPDRSTSGSTGGMWTYVIQVGAPKNVQAPGAADRNGEPPLQLPPQGVIRVRQPLRRMIECTAALEAVRPRARPDDTVPHRPADVLLPALLIRAAAVPLPPPKTSSTKSAPRGPCRPAALQPSTAVSISRRRGGLRAPRLTTGCNGCATPRWPMATPRSAAPPRAIRMNIGTIVDADNDAGSATRKHRGGAPLGESRIISPRCEKGRHLPDRRARSCASKACARLVVEVAAPHSQAQNRDLHRARISPPPHKLSDRILQMFPGQGLAGASRPHPRVAASAAPVSAACRNSTGCSVESFPHDGREHVSPLRFSPAKNGASRPSALLIRQRMEEMA